MKTRPQQIELHIGELQIDEAAKYDRRQIAHALLCEIMPLLEHAEAPDGVVNSAPDERLNILSALVQPDFTDRVSRHFAETLHDFFQSR